MPHFALDRLTRKNRDYRHVIDTTPHQQLVLMNIPQYQEIGMAVHPKITQFIKVEQGHGLAYIDQQQFRLKPGDAVVIPPGARHNILSLDPDGLRLYTIYSPPEHRRGLRQRVKPDSHSHDN